MIKIYPEQDIILEVEFDETIDSFELSFYTDNKDVNVKRTKADLKEGNLIKINSSELLPRVVISACSMILYAADGEIIGCPQQYNV